MDIITDHSLVHEDRKTVEEVITKMKAKAEAGDIQTALQILLQQREYLISLGEAHTKQRVDGLLDKLQKDLVAKYATQALGYVRKGQITEAINLLRCKAGQYYFEQYPGAKAHLNQLASQYEAMLPYN